MKTLVFNLPAVNDFVAQHLGHGERFKPSDPSVGLLHNGKLIAGVVFNNYSGVDIYLSVAAVEPGWLNRAFLRAVFRYPFVQLGCRRVTGLVRVDNHAARKFDEHLGFKFEGLMRQADEDGCDMIVYGMLKDECRWINI